MTRPCSPRPLGLFVAGAILSLGPAAATADQAFASLEAIAGQVSVIRLGQSLAPERSLPLERNDIVVTRRGRATVRFASDGSVLRIAPDSRIQLDESATQRDVTVFFGRLWAHVVRWQERPSRFVGGGTIAAIRGTELSFAFEVDSDETRLSVIEGRVAAENESGSLELTGGQTASARKGRAPALGVQVRPRDAVQWALYYLPVVYGKPAEPQAAWLAPVRDASAAQLAGDLAGALDTLEKVDATPIRDAGFFSFRASLLLAAGSVEDARADIDRALQLSPADADTLALQTIVAVANNQIDEALETAQKAVAAGPRSATAQVALSYARQARFDLEGARESLEAAVALEPDNALAWARLAEIRSSFGRLGEALDAARKATDLEPNLARTQTVLGYTYLAQVRTREARDAFRRAVELDASDPLPRLGLGLARIRDGELSTAGEEMEIALSLDPGQALIRSYLGKVYYEAKRQELVEREYDVAKELDPNDPTPWFYDAIAKQTTNRPVEALYSLQRAIELNDNRAVYRSRLLLDSDLAARSASLGRLYADLGFQNLALVEGWKSVNTDPSNYSAHRLLADAYAALPRHEIARVSELFQSQMLQPLNTTPIQPSLGESSLFLVSSQGPGLLAFNEFNPLFNRDQVNVQGSFVLGQDSTWSGEGIASGIYRKASFSLGYSGFETDGFRANNGQDDRIANAFGQVALSPSTSVQAEVRYRKLDVGDLTLRFFEDDFREQESQVQEATTARVGVRHDVGPGLTLLGSYIRSDKDLTVDAPDPLLGADFDLTRKEKANSFEGQLLYRSGSVKAVAGAGRFDIDADERVVLDLALPFPPFAVTQTDVSDTKVAHTNLYLYSWLSLPRDVTLTLGLSGDFYDEDGTATSTVEVGGFPLPPMPVEPFLGTKNQANPKLGVTWAASSGTTLRAAAFRTLKRTLVTDQTLEPTQVAGFNQFFDDPSATRAWVYGAAVDQKFGAKVFGGLELSKRDLTIPRYFLQLGEVDEKDGEERWARAYLFTAPQNWLTLGAEYQYEEFEADAELFLPYTTVKTHAVPLSARFFHPQGFAALATATYFKQEGEFTRRIEENYVRGDRSFWILDAGVRYRLPSRFGFVAVGVNNLTDEKTTYQATDTRNLQIRPGRTFFARVIVAFP